MDGWLVEKRAPELGLQRTLGTPARTEILSLYGRTCVTALTETGWLSISNTGLSRHGCRIVSKASVPGWDVHAWYTRAALINKATHPIVSGILPPHQSTPARPSRPALHPFDQAQPPQQANPRSAPGLRQRLTSREPPAGRAHSERQPAQQHAHHQQSHRSGPSAHHFSPNRRR